MTDEIREQLEWFITYLQEDGYHGYSSSPEFYTKAADFIEKIVQGKLAFAENIDVEWSNMWRSEV